MSHYKPYPAYKDSGIEWIGRVPEHWSVRPVRFIAQIVNGATPESGSAEYWDGDIAWFTPADLDNDKATTLVEPRRRITVAGLTGCAARLTPPGSVVLSTRAPVGSVGVTAVASATNQGCRTLVPKSGIHPKLLAETLIAAHMELALRSNGTTFQELSTDSLASLRLPFPPPPEQSAIAAALDLETARIDALITKKTRFIELLKEKRQALITHAVTKGLDQNVKMKDSCVEWIGEVPEHWAVPKLRHVATVQTGTAKGKDVRGMETVVVPYLRVANVQDGYLNLTDVAQIEIPKTELSRYLLRPGDVLMNEGGDNDKLGRGHIWRGEIDPCIHQNHVFAVRPHLLSSDWLNTYTGSSSAQAFFASMAKQTTNLASISSSSLMDLPVPKPPADEQADILAHVKISTARLDVLTLKTERTIALLKERRSAVITAAVTGQIDLRGALDVSS